LQLKQVASIFIVVRFYNLFHIVLSEKKHSCHNWKRLEHHHRGQNNSGELLEKLERRRRRKNEKKIRIKKRRKGKKTKLLCEQ
jgi:hypothetical protein